MSRIRGDEVYTKGTPEEPDYVLNPPGSPIDVTPTSANEEQQRGAITAAETVVTFTAEQKSVLVYNDGPNAVHYSIATGVTINHFKIPALMGVVLDSPKTSLYFICAAGHTATIYCYGVS